MCPEAVFFGECENALLLRFDTRAAQRALPCQGWTKIQSKGFMSEAVSSVSNDSVFASCSIVHRPTWIHRPAKFFCWPGLSSAGSYLLFCR